MSLNNAENQYQRPILIFMVYQIPMQDVSTVTRYTELLLKGKDCLVGSWWNYSSRSLKQKMNLNVAENLNQQQQLAVSSYDKIGGKTKIPYLFIDFFPKNSNCDLKTGKVKLKTCFGRRRVSKLIRINTNRTFSYLADHKGIRFKNQNLKRSLFDRFY